MPQTKRLLHRTLEPASGRELRIIVGQTEFIIHGPVTIVVDEQDRSQTQSHPGMITTRPVLGDLNTR